MKTKEQKVSAIEQGTVIDHIPADVVFNVANILKLSKHDGLVSIATNLSSKQLGKKALLKIEHRFLNEQEVDKISVLAPHATVNIIKRYEVKSKKKVDLPQKIENVVKCSNPVCVTNHEKVKTRFSVVTQQPLLIRCYYCERCMTRKEIEIV